MLRHDPTFTAHPRVIAHLPESFMTRQYYNCFIIMLLTIKHGYKVTNIVIDTDDQKQQLTCC